jgi:hypothetical protein
MSLRNRLRRLEQRIHNEASDEIETVIFLPDNGRGGPMKLPRRSGNIVIYDAEKGVPEKWREIESEE